MELAVIVVVMTVSLGAQSPSPKGQTSAGKVGSVPQRPSVVLTFTPPASEADSTTTKEQILSALRATGSQYETYELSDARAEVTTQELGLVVFNNLHKFLDSSGSQRILTTGIVSRSDGSSVAPATRNQISATILSRTKGYLSQKCKVTDQAGLRLMVMIYDAEGTYFDSNQRPYGVMRIRLYLLDTKASRVLWYSEKPWAPGNNTTEATTEGAASIQKTLDKLFGL